MAANTEYQLMQWSGLKIAAKERRQTDYEKCVWVHLCERGVQAMNPTPYHLTAAGIIAALLLLAGRSDMGAPLWQTLLGLLACGVVTAVALGVYHLDEVDKRHREQLQRRNKSA